MSGRVYTHPAGRTFLEDHSKLRAKMASGQVLWPLMKLSWGLHASLIGAFEPDAS